MGEVAIYLLSNVNIVIWVEIYLKNSEKHYNWSWFSKYRLSVCLPAIYNIQYFDIS